MRILHFFTPFKRLFTIKTAFFCLLTQFCPFFNIKTKKLKACQIEFFVLKLSDRGLKGLIAL